MVILIWVGMNFQKPIHDIKDSVLSWADQYRDGDHLYCHSHSADCSVENPLSDSEAGWRLKVGKVLGVSSRNNGNDMQMFVRVRIEKIRNQIRWKK